MTIEIHYNPTSALYDITDDGATLGSAEYHADAYAIERAYQEAQASWAIGGMEITTDPNGLDKLRDSLEAVEDEQCEQDFAQPQIEAYPYTATNFTCACGAPATLYVHGADIDEDVCQACFERNYENNFDDSRAWEVGPIIDTTPLLAQCAHVIRAVLGNVPAGGGIINELRRCDAALTKQGW